MGWVEPFRGSIIAVDSSPFIYLIEEHATFLPLVEELFVAAEAGDVRCVTSTVTLAEVLVHPFRLGRGDLISRYRDILTLSPDIIVYPATVDIAENAARLRAIYGIRTPDAIQIATALAANASAFVTNDARLESIADLKVITLSSLIQAER